MKENYDEAEGDYYIMVLTRSLPGYYGKAKTIDQAIKNCVEESGKNKTFWKGRLTAFLAHKDVTVTEMGGWRRPHNVPDPIRIGRV